MKKMLSMIVAVVAAGALVAAPVNAGNQKPLSGPLELEFNGVVCPQTHAPPFLTWAGTVELNGTTYGFADFPTAPLIEDGKFIYFEEYWTMFSLEEHEAVTPEIACDPTRVVLAGVNDGWGTPGMTAKADGTVTEVADPGPFEDVAPGSRMFWRGRVVGETGTEFLATFHIKPLR
ncbi:MAG: hypothetical protein QNM02_12595 [Acidimicrobiia bacterium]|nr:hypothetical protein [Acidimicrobiia bacterium]